MNVSRKLLVWTVVLGLPSVALFASMYVVSNTWERVRTKPQKRTLKVTGSATKRIISDLIEWQADVETQEMGRTAAAQALRQHVNTATKYLIEQGVKPDDVRTSSVTTFPRTETETVTQGTERVTRRVHKGWSARQSISVRSSDINTVERMSREVTALLEKGVPISSQAPRYHFTGLGEVKVALLAEAAANARERAEKIVRAGGGTGLGAMWNADMGVININPANSTATSWEGNNDKSSLEKDIITIVHLTFEL